MMRTEYRGKILAMDQEELIRNLFDAVLSRFGYNVWLAKHGRDVFELYKSEAARGEAFDLVIIDLSVGRGMGGAEVFDRLRAFDPNIRVVVSSGNLPNGAVEVYKTYGFADVLPKPFSLERMANVVNRALSDRVSLGGPTDARPVPGASMGRLFKGHLSESEPLFPTSTTTVP